MNGEVRRARARAAGSPARGPIRQPCEPQKRAYNKPLIVSSSKRRYFPVTNTDIEIALVHTLRYASSEPSRVFNRPSPPGAEDLVEHLSNRKLDAAEALLRIRGHWLRHVLHDVRGPLFAARGYLKLMLDERAGPVTVTQERYLQIAIENINKLSLLVNTLRDCPTGELLDLEMVNVTELLQGIASECRNREQTLHFRECISAGEVYTAADRAKLSFAMHKLLGSTVEFSRSGGEVQVQACQDEDEWMVRLTATRARADSSDPVPSPADLASPCEILRLHGGIASVDTEREGVYRVSFRLPLVQTLG